MFQKDQASCSFPALEYALERRAFLYFRDVEEVLSEPLFRLGGQTAYQALAGGTYDIFDVCMAMEKQFFLKYPNATKIYSD